MFSPIEKKKINCLMAETESKTKSSSIREENITNKKINQKKKIKRNETSSISSNNKNKIKFSDKNMRSFKIKNDKEKTKVIKDKKDEDKNKKLIRAKKSNYIQKKYNLAEAYRKNHILEKIHRNNGSMTYKGMKYFKIYNFINDGCNQIKNDNIYIRNSELNNKNIKPYIYGKNNDLYDYDYDNEQIEEDDYKNFTASYRDKMVYKLKEKLNRDNIVNNNIIDDSLSELKTEKQSISLLDMHSIQKDRQENKKRKVAQKKVKSYINSDNNIFKTINKEEKTQNKFLKKIRSRGNKDYIKELNKNKTDIGMYNCQINKLNQKKNKEFKNLVGLIKKDELSFKKTKTILLIKDLIKNFNKPKQFSYLSFNNSRKLNNNNNNANKNIICAKSTKKQSASKNKNKNDSKKLENKTYKLNEKKNSNLNNEYYKMQFSNNKMYKKKDIQNISKENKNLTQKVCDSHKNRGCVFKKNSELDLVLKQRANVCLNNLINNNKSKINICTEYLNNNKENKKNHRVMFMHNIKNQMKLDENQTWFNRTMEKENKILASSIIKKNKKKINLLNITSNSNTKDFSLSIKKQNNYKSNKAKELNLRNIKNKKKIEIQFLTPSISSLILKEHKLSSRIKKNSKNNNYSNDVNMASVINKYANDSFNKKKI